MAARARGLTEVDAAEWALFARRITALPGRRPVVSPEPSPRQPAPPDAPSRSIQRVTDHASPLPARPAPLGIGGQPPGVDTATWQRFDRGQLGGTRKLDLHGMTAQHAFAALRAFLRMAHADRVRCVEVVTGRGDGEGGGVLRRELPLWLNLPDIRPMVLAAAHPRTSSAMHSHSANSGSVRLLLRRPRG
jgi:DNA-nicking Smr family endonuclease